MAMEQEVKITEMYKKFQQATNFYGGQPPISVLTGITNLNQDETKTLWKEYVDTLPDNDKPVPKKRGPRRKTPTIRKPQVVPHNVAPERQTVKPITLIDQILSVLSNTTYMILVIAEIIVAFVALFSIGENPALQWVLGVLGAVLTFVGISMFLRGQNAKGSEKVIYLSFWLLYVVTFVSLNWAWVIGNLEAGWKEQDKVLQYKELDEADYNANTNAIREIEKKLNSTSQWVENYSSIVDSYTKQKDSLTQQNAVIYTKLNAKSENNSLSVFATMGGLLGWEGIQTSKIWYLMFLLLIQGATVLTVPKSKG